MENKKLIIDYQEYASREELPAADRALLDAAIAAIQGSYAPYSHFNVGAAVRLADGTVVKGANQENAAYPSGLCAERTALFAAGAEYPDEPVKILAIAARGTDGQLTDEPVSPCGTCRQVIIETETRHRQPVVILLYGRRCVYRMEGIRQLMPLSFTEF